MLVQSSNILELVEIAMSMFDSHALQDTCICAFFSWATCSNANDRASEHLATPLIIEHVDTTRVHAYLDTAISI